MFSTDGDKLSRMIRMMIGLHSSMTNQSLRVSETSVNRIRCHYLDLSHNNIRFIADDAFLNLSRWGYFDLSSNQISSLRRDTFRNLPSLYRLNLENNRLTYLHRQTYRFNTNLMRLLLDGNFLDFDILDLPSSITDLSLENNRIHRLPIVDDTLPILDTIILSGNNTTTITRESFHYFPRLTFLVLCNCSLFPIDVNSFEYNPSLKYLMFVEKSTCYRFLRKIFL